MTTPLALTPLGHSCVLIEIGTVDATVRVVIDPGNLTPQLTPIEGLDAILVTHAHQDHVDPAQIERLRGGEAVPVYGDEAAVQIITEAGLAGAEAVQPGAISISGLAVDVSQWEHEPIYPGVPVPVDLGFLISGRIFAPGDSFAVPDFVVDVLLLPTGAPWMKLAETIDYMRAVAPRIVVPVHDGGLAKAHREMHRSLMQKFAPDGTTVLRPETGERVELD